jgi:hypothetical protein
MTETLGALSRSRPSAAIAGVALVLGTALALGGCIGGASQDPTPDGSGLATTPGANGPPTTTATEWGAIWDSLPATFPVYPGAEPVEPTTGPASATLVVPETVPAAIVWWQAGLEQAGYSTAAVSGPLEDGGMVIDATGSGDCRIQVAVAPTGATTIATILFGADCPYR